MRASLLLLCCSLAACVTPPVPTVSVPVPVACVKEKPARPALATDAELAALDDYQLALALDLYRLQAGPYILKLEAAVDGCSKLSAPSGMEAPARKAP